MGMNNTQVNLARTVLANHIHHSHVLIRSPYDAYQDGGSTVAERNEHDPHFFCGLFGFVALPGGPLDLPVGLLDLSERVSASFTDSLWIAAADRFVSWRLLWLPRWGVCMSVGTFARLSRGPTSRPR